MTATARITQADMERAIKTASAQARKAGGPARVIFRLEAREIEVIVNESGEAIPPKSSDEWSDDDV